MDGVRICARGTLTQPLHGSGLLDGNLIQGNVVIFDEAHNIESVCCQAASFDISPENIAACEHEVLPTPPPLASHPKLETAWEVEKALQLSSADLDIAKRSGDSTTQSVIETDLERFKALQDNVVT